MGLVSDRVKLKASLTCHGKTNCEFHSNKKCVVSVKLENSLGSKLNSYIEVWLSIMESSSDWRQRHFAGLEDNRGRQGRQAQ